MFQNGHYEILPGLLLGFHGTDQAIVDRVLRGHSHLEPSKNSYDWLGVNGAVEKHAVSRQDFGKTLDLEKFRVDKETSLELVFTISPTR